MTPGVRSLILLVSCPDRPGLIAGVTRFIHAHRGNITDLDQHVDGAENTFLMRVAWEHDGFGLSTEDFRPAFQSEVAGPAGMTWSLHDSTRTTRIAVFVSSQLHCAHDLLTRTEMAEWNAEIVALFSNHEGAAALADRHHVPFYHAPVQPGGKAEVESGQLDRLVEHRVDLLVLARYMQILSPGFVERFPNRIINIHHSFLPAFPGARPYHSAYARGVKIIGATSHYVTSDLDEGPIIEQDVVRVSHRDSVADLIRRGRDLEKLVLSRAVWHHLERRVIAYGRRTVVFN